MQLLVPVCVCVRVKLANLQLHSLGCSSGRTSGRSSGGGSGPSAAVLHHRFGWDATAAYSGNRTLYRSPLCHM